MLWQHCSASIAVLNSMCPATYVSERSAMPAQGFLRYHDPDNWPLLRKALKQMGRRDLIGNGTKHLVPSGQPPKRHRVVKPGSGNFRTLHTREHRGKGGRR